MLVAVIVILAGVVLVASGRGGEMAPEYPDYPPIDLGPVSAADVALLRPPSAVWGYNMRVTDEALEVIARAVTDRDVKISALQQEVSDLRAELAQDWTRGSVPPGVVPGGDQRAGGGERPDEGPGPAEPVWPPDEENPHEENPHEENPHEENVLAGTEPTWPPWAHPEPAGPQTAEPETAEPQPGTRGAALPGESPHPAPAYEEPSYDESSYEGPAHEGWSAQDGPGHGTAQYRAWDDPDDQADWDEPHQTLVWGAAHQQAKASRLQEPAAQPQDTPAEDTAAEDEPYEDKPGPHTRAEDTHGPHPAGPPSAAHWAEVTASPHSDEAWRAAQPGQDRE
jgi:hypothetical protein